MGGLPESKKLPRFLWGGGETTTRRGMFGDAVLRKLLEGNFQVKKKKSDGLKAGKSGHGDMKGV